MATLDELVIQLSADTKDLQAELRSAVQAMQKSTEKMGDSVQKFSDKGKKNLTVFETALASMAGFIGSQLIVGAFNKLTGAAAGFFESLIVDGVKAASATESALNDLVGALARNGNAVGDVKADMDAFASSLQETSMFGDDMVLSAAALIENIAKLDTEALKPATQAAADLAATLNIDLNTAASLVAKGIEGNTAAFKRYGITVEEGSGKTENFANVMAALSNQQGAAAAKLKTFEGQVALLSNTWEDFTKIFGEVLIKNPAVISAMEKLNKALGEVSNIVQGAAPELKRFVAEGMKPIVEAFNAAAQAALFFMSGINNVKLANAVAELDHLESSLKETQDRIKAIKEGSSQGFGIQFSDKALGDLQKNADLLQENVTKQNAFVAKLGETTEKTDTALADMAGSFQRLTDGVTSFDAAGAALDTNTEKIVNNKRALSELTEEQKNLQKVALDLAATADSSDEITKMEIDALTARNEAKLISEQEYFDQKAALVQFNIDNERAMLDQAIADGLLTKQEQANAEYALDMKSAKAISDLDQERKKKEAENNKQRAKDFDSTMGIIAGLASSNNKTLAGIGKAAAIYQATLDTYAAANKAFASAPPPFNFALAAAVTAAGLANVAKISGASLASGIDEVPGIGARDNFPAILAPGERVVPTKTNEDLTEFLKGQGQAKAQINVTVTMNDIFTSDPREMGRKIIETINEAAQANGIQLLGNQIR